MGNQKGFTLIELVVVIVILGILAAVAVPKFVDLRDEASTAALDGVVGNIASASAINYAARTANPAKGVATVGQTCNEAAVALLEGGLPAEYSLNATALVAGSNTCTVTQTISGTTKTKPVVIIGVN